MDEKALLDAMREMMREELEPMKRDLADVKQRVTKIETAQEQVTNKKNPAAYRIPDGDESKNGKA